MTGQRAGGGEEGMPVMMLRAIVVITSNLPDTPRECVSQVFPLPRQATGPKPSVFPSPMQASFPPLLPRPEALHSTDLFSLRQHYRNVLKIQVYSLHPQNVVLLVG